MRFFVLFLFFLMFPISLAAMEGDVTPVDMPENHDNAGQVEHAGDSGENPPESVLHGEHDADPATGSSRTVVGQDRVQRSLSDTISLWIDKLGTHLSLLFSRSPERQ